MGRTSSIRVQRVVEIGGRMATGDGKQRCFCVYVCLSICMFVTLMSRKDVRTFSDAYCHRLLASDVDRVELFQLTLRFF